MIDNAPFKLLLNWTQTLLIFLWIGTVASLLNIPALGFLTYPFLLCVILQLLRSRRVFRPLWLALFAVGAAFAWKWLGPLWSLPSNDDTVNHLGLVQAILKSGQFLIGKIDKPGAEYLGSAPYHFYPSGTHVLIDFFAPLNHSLPKLMKAVVWATLAIYPVALVSSGMQFLRNNKNIQSWVIFAAIAAMTQAVFPVSSLGEGGMSRIVAIIWFIPLWFHWLSDEKGFFTGIFFGAIASPMLLFLHPSILPFLGVTFLWFRGRVRLGALVSLPVGLLLFYAMMKSAPQEVLKPELLAQLTQDLPRDVHGWFERLKSPFHYWFSDPDGFLKFLSPKDYLVYAAVICAIAGKILRRYLLLFVIPFAIAATALIDSNILHQLGLIYYHSTKRASELTPLLGFTLAMALLAHPTLINKFQRRWITHAALPVLSVAFLIVFWNASQTRLDGYHRLYHSLHQVDAEAMRAQIEPKLPKNAQVIRIEHPRLEFLRYELTPQYPIFTIRPECQEVTPSPYCERRAQIEWKGVHKVMIIRAPEQIPEADRAKYSPLLDYQDIRALSADFTF